MTQVEERRAGRPPATDSGAIALVATRLFLERGFDDVTMADVAAAAGIGRSTLFRYFPSKGSLLWYQHDLHVAQFRQAMATTPPGVPMVDAVFGAYVAFMGRHAHEMTLARSIMAVIATAPPASTGKWETFADWAGYIAEYAALRRGGTATDADNRVLGLVLWSALMSAGEQWALSNEGDLRDHVMRARATLKELDRPT